MSTKFTIATFLTLFALNPCAETLTETDAEHSGIQSEGGSSEVQISIGNLDHDGDGKISRSESNGNKNIRDQFDGLDANQDGLLDQSEFSQFEPAKPSAED